MEFIIRLIDRVTKRLLLYFWILGIVIFLTNSNISDLAKWQTRPTFISDIGEHVEPEPEPEPIPKWQDNIMPETKDKIYLTWAYKPQKFDEKPSGVNVLAPLWFYVEDKGGDGIPRLMDIIELGREADFNGYVNQSHEQGAKVWGTVVSFNPSLTDPLIHTSEYRQAFIEKMAAYIEELSLDGINFDFENMNPAHKMDFTEFVKDCADAWRPLGCVISVDVTVKSGAPDSTNWYQCYDHKSLGEVADYLAVMAYDQHSNHSVAGPVASLEWVDDKIKGILEDVPSNKILLGIPFYGRDFPSMMMDDDPDALEPTWSSGSRGVVTIFKKHVDEMLDSDRFTNINNKEIIVKEWLVKNEWMENDEVHYLKFIDQNDMFHEIWYDDEKSLALKADLVNKYHLAGVAVWQQSYGRDSFWEAVGSEIGLLNEISAEEPIKNQNK